jgi:hypothetical protein
MTKQVADSGERRTFAFKLDRVGVPQAVCVDALFDASLKSEPWEQVPDVGLLDNLAVERAEDG